MSFTRMVRGMSNIQKGTRQPLITLSNRRAPSNHRLRLDASFVPWLTGLRQHLLGRYPLGDGISPLPEDELLGPKWKLSLVEDVAGSSHCTVPMNNELRRQRSYIGHETPLQGYLLNKDAKQGPHGLTITLENNQRLTPREHWQDVRQFIFTTPLSVAYEPGDVLIIYPKNRQEDVDLFISMMQWTEIADSPVQCIHTQSFFSSNGDQSQPLGVRLPLYTTLRSLLTNNLDFTAIPRRSFFSTIAHFTLDAVHKERLLEFTKAEYIDDFYDYTTRPRRSILEVLQEFRSVRIPWQWAVDVLPELRGRQFSIASGGELKNNFDQGTRFELLVAIVKYKTVIKKIREGVCTRYLASLPCGAQIQATLHKGGLGISRSETNLPVIMIAPGTGVAPMRSLIWERLEWGKKAATQAPYVNGSTTNESKTGETLLFFGCRRHDADYFFEEEWAKISEEMSLQVFTAFSRDQATKIYVQDLIKENSATVFRLLHQFKGIVYVCGSSGNMPRAVRASLVEAFKISGGLEQAAADAYLLGMEKEGRYRQETW